MAVVGVLEVQMAADLARLTKDMDTAKRTVNSAVGQINNILGTIGVGVSLAGVTSMIASMVTSVVNAGDRLNDLRKITGITVEDLGGLGKAARLNGSDLESVAKAIGIMNDRVAGGAAVFKTIGVATQESTGQFRASKDILLDVADRFARMENGVQKAALAQELFGKSGRALIPLLNEGRAALEVQMNAYASTTAMTTRLAEQSDRFNDILVELNGGITNTKNSFVGGLLPALNDIGSAFTKVSGSAQLFNSIGSGLGLALKGIVIAVATAAGALKSLGFAIDGIGRQLLALINLDFKGAIAAGDKYFDNIAKTAKGNAEFVKSIIEGDKALSDGEPARQKMLDFQTTLPTVTVAATRATTKQNKEFNMQLYLLKQYESEAKRAADITESVATEQEIYNKKLAELNQLKPYLTIQTYDRALAKLNDTNKKAVVSTERTTDAITQFWIQANRNIQTSLSNGIFDFFTDGLDGMVRSVKTAVLRIISEFAALKILEFFGGGGATGTTGGTVSTMAALAGMFGGGRTATTSAASSGVFSNAGGAGTAFIGGQGTALGGSGMGVTATRTNSVLSGGNLMALGAMAGPYGMAAAAAFMAMQALEKKVGDYKLSGGAKFALGAYEMFSPMAYTVKGLGLQTPEALIGKFLFGRGPYKFRQQSIQGDVSSQGLDGTITDVFKSKGGVFKKNKHKEFETAIPSEIIRDVDKTITNIYKSTHEFAKNLGMDASQIDKFTREIQVKSEKGKTITTEAMTEMLTTVADDVAKAVMPDVESFSLTGESASKTFERLNNELEALRTGAENLGASAVYASKLVNMLSIDERMAGIDMVGGIERLNELTLGFFDGMLKPTEKLAVRTDQLNTELAKWGVSTDMSIEQYKGLVQAESTANDFRLALLELVPAFLQVKSAVQQIKDAANQNTLALAQDFAPEEVLGIKLGMANDAMKQFGLTADMSKDKITGLLKTFVKSGGMFTDISGDVMKAAGLYLDYQNELSQETAQQQEALNNSREQENNLITLIGNNIRDLEAIAQSLRNTINSINPMPLEDAISQLKFGTIRSSNLQQALSTVSSANGAGFSNVLDFNRARGQAGAAINKLGNRAQLEIMAAKESLASFDVGGVVPRTGIAMIHKNEQVLTANESADMSKQIGYLTKAVEVLTISNNRMNRRFDKWDNEGLPDTRVA